MSVRAQRGRNVSFCSCGAEQLQRLRHADRLVRGEQRADRRAGRADQRQRLVVVHLGEAEAAVLGVDLHAEGAELLEPVDDLVGDPRLALDPGAVDLRLAEVAQPGRGTPRRAGRPRRRGQRVRVDQVEPEAAEEQLLGEAGLAPVLFPGGLGDLPGLALGDLGRAAGCVCGHEGPHLAAESATGLPTGATCPYYPNSGTAARSTAGVQWGTARR